MNLLARRAGSTVIKSAAQTDRRGFHLSIGAVIAAALLAIGFQGVVEGLENPLAALLASFINFLLKRKHAQVYPLAVPYFHWSLQVDFMVIGAVVVALGLRLGFWLHRKDEVEL